MEATKIRNVALVGHGGSGKTSLAEALLYVGGATNRLGSVEQGTTIFDFEPEEAARQISLVLSVGSFNWGDHKINLLDTPGYADFYGEALAGLRAADLALFVVSGVDGVEVGTELLWRSAAEMGLPRAVVISKLDRERASFDRTLTQLRDMFGKQIAPIQVPVLEAEKLVGLARVVSSKVFRYEDGDRRGKEGTGPPEAQSVIEASHTALIESVVETDDALMEAYFEGTEPERPVIVEKVHQGMLAGEICPVLVTSAETGVGVDILAEFLVEFGPTPLERQVPPTLSGELSIDPEGDTVAYVFKTISDPFVGKISMFRVFSGSASNDHTLEYEPGRTARMHNLFFQQGNSQIDTTEVVCGDIAAVAKLEAASRGVTLSTPGSGIRLGLPKFPTPVTEFALSPKSAQDDEKMSQALSRMVEEDPTLRMERRSETGETILAGLGDLHLDITLARIARKYGVEIETALPQIPYRETITSSGAGEGKHKKQSGGRGQFGVAMVRFAPRPRGSGYEFINSIKGGAIPRQWIPAVDKGVREAFERGMVAGYPVVDVSAEVYDGKFHAVDSDEISFKMAGIQAVRDASDQLRPALLEPICKLTVWAPEDNTGDIIGDINAKRGRVLGMDSDGNRTAINAEVPMAEVQRYSVDLRSLTSGRGSFEVSFDHYQEVPHQEAQKVLAARNIDNE